MYDHSKNFIYLLYEPYAVKWHSNNGYLHVDHLSWNPNVCKTWFHLHELRKWAMKKHLVDANSIILSPIIIITLKKSWNISHLMKKVHVKKMCPLQDKSTWFFDSQLFCKDQSNRFSQFMGKMLYHGRFY